MTDAAAAAGMTAGDLFQIFRDGDPRTRSEVAELTGMPRNRVAARVGSLTGSGLLAAAGAAASTGGRPSSRVAFNTAAGRILALELGTRHARVAVTDLAAAVQDAEVLQIDAADGPEEVLGAVMDHARSLLARHPRTTPLVGVGVSVPAVVEHRTGTPLKPPILPGWDGFPVREHVSAAFGVPVFVDNDVNMLAVGERARFWPHVDDLIFVKVATGLGAGIIAGGILQRGTLGSAGEIGHVRVPYNALSSRPAEDEQELGSIASGGAIAAALRQEGMKIDGVDDLVRLAASGDAVVGARVREAGREVGEVLALLVNLLNPEVIVIGGSVARAGEDLLAGVRETVYRRSLPLATTGLTVTRSGGDENSVAVGAALLVTENALSPSGVDAWVNQHDRSLVDVRAIEARASAAG